MPITSFPGFDDGLVAESRRRDHFLTTLDLEDDRLWVPYGETAWFQPCQFNVTSGGFGTNPDLVRYVPAHRFQLFSGCKKFVHA